MTLRYSVLPAADQDLDGQADFLAREASLENALRCSTTRLRPPLRR